MRLAVGISVASLLGFGIAFADDLADDALRRGIVGNTLKGKTAKDGDAWRVVIRTNGLAEFTFANGARSSAKWEIKGRRIEFVFPKSGDRTCRMIVLTEDGRQHWKDCETGRTSSYIVQPLLARDRRSEATSAEMQDVRKKLADEAESLKAQGYVSWRAASLEVAAKGSSVRQKVDLLREATYALVAACDHHCSHVVLTLLDPNGREFARSPEKHHTVILAGPATIAGSYEAEITAPGCKQGQCVIGLEVLRLEKPR